MKLKIFFGVVLDGLLVASSSIIVLRQSIMVLMIVTCFQSLCIDWQGRGLG